MFLPLEEIEIGYDFKNELAGQLNSRPQFYTLWLPRAPRPEWVSVAPAQWMGDQAVGVWEWDENDTGRSRQRRATAVVHLIALEGYQCLDASFSGTEGQVCP